MNLVQDKFAPRRNDGAGGLSVRHSGSASDAVCAGGKTWSPRPAKPAQSQRFPAFTRWAIPTLLLGAFFATDAAACGEDYLVQTSDTIFSIAEDHYGDGDLWTLVHVANQNISGELGLKPGKPIFIPCADETTATNTVAVALDDPEIRFRTVNDNAPFTDQSLPGSGMVTELVTAAMELTPRPISYAISWDDDWKEQETHLLDTSSTDMVFPRFKPDCAATPLQDLCTEIAYSDPLVQMPIMLFVTADNQFEFESDADVLGKTLCRPKGYLTQDLDRRNRRWLSKQLVELKIEDNAAACFAKLTAGDVDAVAVDLFLGAQAILEMDLHLAVVPLERPLSNESLHVAVSNQDSQAREQLDQINAGLESLRSEGRYQEIVSRHLDLMLPKLETDAEEVERLDANRQTDSENPDDDASDGHQFELLSENISPDHLVAFPPKPVEAALAEVETPEAKPAETEIATVTLPETKATEPELAVVEIPEEELVDVEAAKVETPEAETAEAEPVQIARPVAKPVEVAVTEAEKPEAETASVETPAPETPERVSDASIVTGVSTSPRPALRPKPPIRITDPVLLASPQSEPSNAVAGNPGTQSPEAPAATRRSVSNSLINRAPNIGFRVRKKAARGIVVVGVFDLGEETWGLFGLPNGEIRELRPGQAIAGVAIESINGQTVMVQSGNGRKALRTGDVINLVQQ